MNPPLLQFRGRRAINATIAADYLRAMRAQLELAASHSATLTERWS